jgi:hypothetical protein
LDKSQSEACTYRLRNTHSREYLKRARALIEPGFEYVCEIQDAKLFRKRK